MNANEMYEKLGLFYVFFLSQCYNNNFPFFMLYVHRKICIVNTYKVLIPCAKRVCYCNDRTNYAFILVVERVSESRLIYIYD